MNKHVPVHQNTYIVYVRTTSSNIRLNKRTKIKDNAYTIFVNAIRPIMFTSATIERL